MSDAARTELESLSPWWGRAVAFTFVMGFAVLILLTFKAYQNAPPVAARVVDSTGTLVTPEMTSGTDKKSSSSMA